MQQYGDWYTGRGWMMGCYIWYSEEGPERAAASPSPLLAVRNVTAHASIHGQCTWQYNCFCYYKGLIGQNVWCQGRAEGSTWSVKCPLCKFRTYLGPTSIQELPVNPTAIKHSGQMSDLRGHHCGRQLCELQPRCATKGACGLQCFAGGPWNGITELLICPSAIALGLHVVQRKSHVEV